MSNQFVKLFADGNALISTLAKSKQVAAIDVFMYFLDEMDMDSGSVAVSKPVLAAEVGVSVRSVYYAISILVEHDAIKVPFDNVFAVNPLFAWCGKSQKYCLFRSAGKSLNRKIKHVANPKADPEKSIEVKVRLAMPEVENA